MLGSSALRQLVPRTGRLAALAAHQPVERLPISTATALGEVAGRAQGGHFLGDRGRLHLGNLRERLGEPTLSSTERIFSRRGQNTWRDHVDRVWRATHKPPKGDLNPSE